MKSHNRGGRLRSGLGYGSENHVRRGRGTGAIVTTVDITRTYSQRTYIGYAEISGKTAQ